MVFILYLPNFESGTCFILIWLETSLYSWCIIGDVRILLLIPLPSLSSSSLPSESSSSFKASKSNSPLPSACLPFRPLKCFEDLRAFNFSSFEELFKFSFVEVFAVESLRSKSTYSSSKQSYGSLGFVLAVLEFYIRANISLNYLTSYFFSLNQ